MSTLTDPRLEVPPPSGVVYQRVEPARREEALALLLTGRLDGAEAAVGNFLEFASSQSLKLDQFFAAYRGGPLGAALASMLIVPCAGRTAMTFLSPLAAGSVAALALGDETTSIVGGLVRAALTGLEPSRVRLAQALLEPHQQPEAAALAAGGYRKLAHLAYLQHPGLAAAVELDLAAGVEAVRWDRSQRRLFAETIAASYVETADCPGLVGIRAIEDVMAGHMATGEFEPALWLALHRRGEPVGVALLNRVLHRTALELVYFGLAKPWRGRRLGRQLLMHALGQVGPWQAQHLILAVDELNAAAMRLYRELKFHRTARKLAMICVLP